MSFPCISTAVPTPLRKAGPPSPPSWVAQLTGIHLPECDSANDDFGVSHSAAFARLAVRIPDAVSFAPDDLRDLARESYFKIFNRLLTAGDMQPVRFWNFLPRIHDRIDGQQSRYMVFNAGRFLAFQDHYGDSRVFDRNVATASAVGHHDRDLWIHCLAAIEPGIHLGNPRQVSPHRYSARFGRLPPCFARATLLPGRAALLIAGTASICGEESLHADLDGQLTETLANLAAVIEAGQLAQSTEPGRVGPDAHANRGDTPRLCTERASLNALTDMRIYHPRSADLRWLNDQLRLRLGDRPRLEFLQADLCRSELLVEIEALADLS